MSRLNISLFGKLDIRVDNQPITTLDKIKVQELLCYLLLYRQRTHTRESLAGLLWQYAQPKQARCYLRKALWQLQSALESEESLAECQILAVDAVWIGINPLAALLLDTAVVEKAYNGCEGIPGRQLNEEQVNRLKQAADVYKGDLLEGWYEDWCVYERERMQRMYLIILDKLVESCIARGEHERGLSFGNRILDYDVAHERTHRHLMRLHYLAGDRTNALRQFEKCEALLQKELGVSPSKRTVTLYHQIQVEQMPMIDEVEERQLPIMMDPVSSSRPVSRSMHDWLEQLHTELNQLQQTVTQKIHIIEALLDKQDRSEIRVK